MTSTATRLAAKICTDSTDWLRSKSTTKPGDWIVIVRGSIRTREGLCWIRNNTEAPTFDGPYTTHYGIVAGDRVWQLGPRYQPTKD